MKFTNPLRTSMYATVGALLLTLSSFAQAPEKMSYQAVIRGANNALVTNQQIGMQISILQGSTAVYEETQTLTSNPNGLVSLEIGKGTIVSGIFSSIDWSADMYFIKIETDPTGGTNYTITGTSQLLSVPYALYAKTSSDTEAVAANTAKVGYTDALVSANTSDIATNTTNIATKVSITDIVDDLTTGGTTAPLSAEQGKVLKGLVDSSVNIVVEDVLTSSSTINALSANQGRELKGLINTNTNNILTNTSDIANAVMTSGDQTVAGIKTFSNPIVSDVTGNLTGNVTGNAGTVTNGVYTTSSVTALSDVTDVGSGAIITGAERAKLATIESSADVTDATNVAAAGALMDSEVSDLAGIKAVTVSTLQVKPSEGAFADGDKTKLDGIEDNADVTDATNVADAGALMDSEVSDLAGIKAVTVSTLQVKPSEGAFADGDKTKLDGIEDNADVTDATNVADAGALMDSEVSDLAGIKAVTVSTLQVKPSEGAFADGDKTKLDGIEDNADVTDATNVADAGALMDSEVSDLAGIKAVTVSTLQVKPSEGAFADGDKTKLDGIEDNADVTDATNVADAGALMDSEVSDLAGIKAVTVSTLQVKPSEGAFADGDKTKLDGIEDNADVTDATNVADAGALMDSEVSDLAGIKAVTVSTLQVKPSEGAFADGDKTKLDGIEDNADVTDATNVADAGALMDSEVSDLAGIKAVTVSTLQVKPSEGAFADGDKTKLDGIEDNADVTDATNVADAGALMDSEVSDLAGIKAVTVSTLQVKPSEGAFADGDKTKLDGIEDNADVTDATNVADAGALMDSEVSDLAGIKAVTVSTLQVKPSEGAFADGDKTKLDGIEDNADVTDATNVADAGALMDSEVSDLAGIKAVTVSTLQVKPSEGAFADGDKTKLDGIEDNADVTDATNVADAGALMDSEVSDLAGIKAVTVSTLQVKPSEGAFADGDKTKLDGIEDNADVTDATNVADAGALMDSEVSDLAGIKAVTVSTLQVKPSEGAFADGDKTKLDGIEDNADVTDATNVADAGALMDSEVSDLAGIKAVTVSTLQVKPSEGAFADGDKTKLDGIEDNADVTDATNVADAGALMDSEVSDLAGIKAVTVSTLQVKPSEGAFADGDKTKLDGIEDNADVTDATNVADAGALMDSEVSDLAGIKAVTVSTLQVKPSEGAFADGDKTKLDGIEDNADVTDATNVADAGALMDSEVSDLAGIKAVTVSTLQVKPSEGAFADGDKTKLDGITIHFIGESYGGGIVFFVYDGGQHGLIAATADRGNSLQRIAGVPWFGGSYTNTRARADGIGAGLKNTAIIIADQVPEVENTGIFNDFAATLCNEYSVTEGDVTYGDWYLPSKYELDKMYLNKETINDAALLNGGSKFLTNLYWSSTENGYYSAWRQNFADGSQYSNSKSFPANVRAVRAF